MSAMDTPSKTALALPLPRWARSFTDNRALIAQLARREFQQRTRGAFLGIVWWLLSPLLLLCAYTFVFAYVLGIKWGVGTDGSPAEFAMRLFCSLIIYTVIAEVIAVAPDQIVVNEQYVKRIIFPVDILPIVSLVVSSIGWIFSFVILLVMTTIFEGLPAPTALLAPVLMLPVLFLAMGFGWAMSAMGVFVRDLRNAMQIVLPMLMFLSPVFYPIDRLEQYIPSIQFFHPLAAVMEQIRASIFEPGALNFLPWITALIISIFIAWIGHALFRKLRPLFADVL
ncbi:MAG: ABC transporter permease [Phycisphaerales bacterium]